MARGKTNRRVTRKAPKAAPRTPARRKPAKRPTTPTAKPRRRRTRILRRSVNRRRDPERDGRQWRLLGLVVGRVGLLLALFVGFVAAGLGVQSGYRSLVASEAFALQRVTVSGVRQLDEAEVLAELGIATGDPLLALDASLLQTRLTLHPWVRHAEVRRQLPDELFVEVQERQPRALVALGHLYLVDVDGEVFKRLGTGDQWDLPVLSGLTREDFGERPEWAHRRLGRGLDLLHRVAEAGLQTRLPISEVQLGETADVLVLEAGTRVHLPEGDPGPALTRLVRILDDLTTRRQHARAVFLDDASEPHRVTVRLGTGRGKGGEG